MTFKLDIAMDSAAFEEHPENEVARILEVVAAEIVRMGIAPRGIQTPVRDINGNTVGEFRAERD
jgi:hypothetical protein